jgi:DNA-directed RNA polymerase subunit beta'
MGNLLDITLRDLEKVIYYSNYVVIEPGEQDVSVNQLLDEDEYLNLRTKAKERTMRPSWPTSARRRCASCSPPRRRQAADELRARRVVGDVAASEEDAAQALKIVDAFRNSGDSGDVRNKPEWMILDVIPVIPPDLRPLVPLDGGRFATSDLNDLYRASSTATTACRSSSRIARRRSSCATRSACCRRRWTRCSTTGAAPRRFAAAASVRSSRSRTCSRASRAGSVRTCSASAWTTRAVRSSSSVPELSCISAAAKLMALELFKPFIIHKLVEKGIAETVKRAKKIVERESPEVYEILGRDHPRPSGAAEPRADAAPPRHPGVRAVLVEGKAIRIHPLVCAAFNAGLRR